MKSLEFKQQVLDMYPTEVISTMSESLHTLIDGVVVLRDILESQGVCGWKLMLQGDSAISFYWNYDDFYLDIEVADDNTYSFVLENNTTLMDGENLDMPTSFDDFNFSTRYVLNETKEYLDKKVITGNTISTGVADV